MSKDKTLPFKFSTPVSGINKIKSQSLMGTSLRVVLLGDLIISGIGYDFGNQNPEMSQYSALVLSIQWKGADLLPLLKANPLFTPFFEEIRNAANHHVETYLFHQDVHAFANQEVYEEANY